VCFRDATLFSLGDWEEAIMTVEFLLRLVGMIVFAVIGWRIGDTLGGASDAMRYIIVLALAGAALV